MTSVGSRFQIAVPATENEHYERLPTVESRKRGTSSCDVEEDRSRDEMKRQRRAPAYPTNIEAPHHVERGTSVAQPCTCSAPLRHMKPAKAGQGISDVVRLTEIVDKPGRRVLHKLHPTLLKDCNLTS